MEIIVSFQESHFSDIFIIKDYRYNEESDCDEYEAVLLKKFIENNFSFYNLRLYYFRTDVEDFETHNLTISDEKSISTSVFGLSLEEIASNYYIEYESSSSDFSGYNPDTLIADLKKCKEFLQQNTEKNEKRIKELALEYYGEDLVDIQDNNITILYPEIIIENSHGKKHLIKELYVNFTIRYLKPENIRGLRGTLLRKEYNCQYLHSHLQRRNGTDYHNFCLGKDTPIRNFTYNQLTNDELILSFFTTLDAYVKWESLEGGPYIRMSEIGNYTRSSLSRIILNKNLKYFLKKYSKIPVVYNSSDNVLQVNLDEIKPLITKIATHVGRVNSDNLFENLSQFETESYSEQQLSANFKGKPIKLKIYSKYKDKISNLEEKIDYSQIVAHPEIMNYITNTLNHKLKNGINYSKTTKLVAEALRTTK